MRPLGSDVLVRQPMAEELAAGDGSILGNDQLVQLSARRVGADHVDRFAGAKVLGREPKEHFWTALDGAGGTKRKNASVPAGAIFRNHVSGADRGEIRVAP